MVENSLILASILVSNLLMSFCREFCDVCFFHWLLSQSCSILGRISMSLALSLCLGKYWAGFVFELKGPQMCWSSMSSVGLGWAALLMEAQELLFLCLCSEQIVSKSSRGPWGDFSHGRTLPQLDKWQAGGGQAFLIWVQAKLLQGILQSEIVCLHMSILSVGSDPPRW